MLRGLTSRLKRGENHRSSAVPQANSPVALLAWAAHVPLRAWTAGSTTLALLGCPTLDTVRASVRVRTRRSPAFGREAFAGRDPWEVLSSPRLVRIQTFLADCHSCASGALIGRGDRASSPRARVVHPPVHPPAMNMGHGRHAGFPDRTNPCPPLSCPFVPGHALDMGVFVQGVHVQPWTPLDKNPGPSTCHPTRPLHACPGTFRFPAIPAFVLKELFPVSGPPTGPGGSP